jgi:site-specific DNA-methyltransferase (adenine-specific)
MNDIFNTDVPLKTETPAFAKHVLPAVPSSDVYLGDCVTALKRYADNHFDLAIVDPPYGIGIAKTGQIGTGNKFTPKNWDSGIPDLEYFNELKRVSKNQIVWGVNYFDGMGLNGGRIIWNKLGRDIGRRKVAPTFSECEIAYFSGANNVKMFSYTYIGNVQGNDYQILWSETNRIHPTQKPIELYDWLLSNYAKEGNLILDTHLGSGSSRIAAYKGGFNFVGFEIDQEYYEKQEKRFNDFKSQLRLF